MKRARDVREQLEGLMQRVEIEIISNPLETVNIRKVRITYLRQCARQYFIKLCEFASYTHLFLFHS